MSSCFGVKGVLNINCYRGVHHSCTRNASKITFLLEGTKTIVRRFNYCFHNCQLASSRGRLFLFVYIFVPFQRGTLRLVLIKGRHRKSHRQTTTAIFSISLWSLLRLLKLCDLCKIFAKNAGAVLSICNV